MADLTLFFRIDWATEATLFRIEESGDWRDVLSGELHSLVQAVNASHDDPADFYIRVADGAMFVGNEIRLIGCDATRPYPDADSC